MSAPSRMRPVRLNIEFLWQHLVQLSGNLRPKDNRRRHRLPKAHCRFATSFRRRCTTRSPSNITR